jgi:hypothetical protein
MGSVFGALWGDLLPGMGSYAEPPDSLVLRILGLAAKPATQDAVRSAFRFRLLRVHPDLNPGTYAAVPVLQDAAEALAMQRPEVAELVWARDALLRKIPQTVTADEGSAGDLISRHEQRRCRACGGERLDPAGRPYRLLGHARGQRRRWVGYCWPCAADAENGRLRDLRRIARADRICPRCDGTFTPQRSDGCYCSDACRQRAYRLRKSTAGAA